MLIHSFIINNSDNKNIRTIPKPKILPLSASLHSPA